MVSVVSPAMVPVVSSSNRSSDNNPDLPNNLPLPHNPNINDPDNNPKNPDSRDSPESKEVSLSLEKAGAAGEDEIQTALKTATGSRETETDKSTLTLPSSSPNNSNSPEVESVMKKVAITQITKISQSEKKHDPQKEKDSSPSSPSGLSRGVGSPDNNPNDAHEPSAKTKKKKTTSQGMLPYDLYWRVYMMLLGLLSKVSKYNPDSPDVDLMFYK